MNAQVRPPNKYHPNTANDEPSEEHLFVLPKAPLWRRVAALFIDIGITVVLVSAFVDTPQFDPADIESLKTGQTTIYDLIEQMITPGLLTAGLIAQMLL
ncbi:MAG: hypothetical protein QF612_04255, partial [Candidatus Thalassarchaeaceae archaeon]|nr:hypothetical protein [Candidatus Thalassarchaeaceae archaeon]